MSSAAAISMFWGMCSRLVIVIDRCVCSLCRVGSVPVFLGEQNSARSLVCMRKYASEACTYTYLCRRYIRSWLAVTSPRAHNARKRAPLRPATHRETSSLSGSFRIQEGNKFQAGRNHAEIGRDLFKIFVTTHERETFDVCFCEGYLTFFVFFMKSNQLHHKRLNKWCVYVSGAAGWWENGAAGAARPFRTLPRGPGVQGLHSSPATLLQPAWGTRCYLQRSSAYSLYSGKVSSLSEILKGRGDICSLPFNPNPSNYIWITLFMWLQPKTSRVPFV